MKNFPLSIYPRIFYIHYCFKIVYTFTCVILIKIYTYNSQDYVDCQLICKFLGAEHLYNCHNSHYCSSLTLLFSFSITLFNYSLSRNLLLAAPLYYNNLSFSWTYKKLHCNHICLAVCEVLRHS